MRVASVFRVKVLFTIAICVFLVSVIWVGYTALQAQYELNKIKLEAVAFQNNSTEYDAEQLADLIKEARTRASAAHESTSGFAWWLITKVPYLGHTPTAVQTVTRNLNATLENSAEIEQVLRESNQSKSELLDASLVAKLLAASSGVKESIHNGATQFSELNYSGVPGFIAVPVRQIGSGFQNLDPIAKDGVTFAKIAPVLLGLDKPRTWMLVFLNGAEARATGGFPGGWGLLQASRGNLKLSALHNDVHINRRALKGWQRFVSTEQANFYGDDLSRWSDLGLSPDFPTTAKLMTALLQQNEGLHVDGVFSFNEHALAQMLVAAGPIQQKGHTLTSENVADYVTKDIYSDYRDPQQKNVAILQIIQQTFDQLSAGRGGPLGIFQALVPSVASGNVQLWSSNPTTQSVLASTKAGNTQSDLENPTHSVALVNGAGNKIDAYIATDVKYTQGICLTDVPYRNSYFRIDLTNQAPKSGLPSYVIPRSDLEPNSKKNPGSTRMLVYVHVPLGSTLNEALLNNRSTQLVSSGEDSGRQVWRFDVENEAQTESTLFVSFNEPAIGNEPTPSIWTQSMPIKVTSEVTIGPRCVR